MTLKEALDVIINKEYLEDFCYEVKDRAWEDPQPEFAEYDKTVGKNVSSWDHPRVKRFSEAVAVLKAELAKP